MTNPNLFFCESCGQQGFEFEPGVLGHIFCNHCLEKFGDELERQPRGASLQILRQPTTGHRRAVTWSIVLKRNEI